LEYKKTTCDGILDENLGMHCVDVSKQHIDHANGDEIAIKNIITGDETWVDSCDVTIKPQTSQWFS
jgi:hypothetical protein